MRTASAKARVWRLYTKAVPSATPHVHQRLIRTAYFRGSQVSANRSDQVSTPSPPPTQALRSSLSQAPTFHLVPQVLPSLPLLDLALRQMQPLAATSHGELSSLSEGIADVGRISGHWQWILMVAILIVGFIFLAWLAVFLKKRHRRKVDQRRAAVSGFPNQEEKREGARAATPDLWGPHQHMAATKGWEYHLNQQGGAVRNDQEEGHERKRSKRERRTPSDMAEVDSHPATSRQTSSRGKGKGRVHTSELASRSPDALENRSRSHTRRKRDREKEPGVRGRIDDDEITPKE